MSTDPEDAHGWIVVPAWIVVSSTISPEAKLVYLLLSAHSDFECRPETVDVTADYFSLDRGLFRKAIQNLIKNGAAETVDGALELRGTQVGVSE
jgi:hypothetical protein